MAASPNGAQIGPESSGQRCQRQRDQGGHQGQPAIKPFAYALAVGVHRLLIWGMVDTPLTIVPAPTRKSAARRRGGDPVARMAATAVAGHPDITVTQALRMREFARDSAGLGSSARERNIAGRVLLRRRRLLTSNEVLLVDDIVTAGASAREAVRVLRTADVRVAAVLAVAAARCVRAVACVNAVSSTPTAVAETSSWACSRSANPRGPPTVQPRPRPAHRIPLAHRSDLDDLLDLAVVLGHGQHGHALQPKHRRSTTVVVHLGPSCSCFLTPPQIVRPQAQDQVDNHVTRPLPRFIAKTRIRRWSS